MGLAGNAALVCYQQLLDMFYVPYGPPDPGFVNYITLNNFF